MIHPTHLVRDSTGTIVSMCYFFLGFFLSQEYQTPTWEWWKLWLAASKGACTISKGKWRGKRNWIPQMLTPSSQMVKGVLKWNQKKGYVLLPCVQGGNKIICWIQAPHSSSFLYMLDQGAGSGNWLAFIPLRSSHPFKLLPELLQPLSFPVVPSSL